MDKLEKLIADIKSLEQELIAELQKKQDEYLYIIKGKKVRFDEETRRYHRTLTTKLRTYIAEASLLHIADRADYLDVHISRVIARFDGFCLPFDLFQGL